MPKTRKYATNSLEQPLYIFMNVNLLFVINVSKLGRDTSRSICVTLWYRLYRKNIFMQGVGRRQLSAGDSVLEATYQLDLRVIASSTRTCIRTTSFRRPTHGWRQKQHRCYITKGPSSRRHTHCFRYWGNHRQCRSQTFYPHYAPPGSLFTSS